MVKDSRQSPIHVYRITDGWHEYEATWASSADDHDPVAVATFTGPISSDGYVRFDISNLIQQWVNGSAPNHGIMLVMPGDDNNEL